MTIRRIFFMAVYSAFLVTVTGCIDATSAILVKKDGSGFIVETVYMGKAAVDMMTGMMAGLGGQANATPGKIPLEIDKYKAKAIKMGEGVQYVSAKQVSKTDGSSGVKVTYSFEDVRKLKISQNPDAPSAGGPGMNVETSKSRDDKKITFDFQPGNSPLLVIKMPPMEQNSPAGKEDKGNKGSQAQDAQGMAMMKAMLKDMRIRLMVKVDGNITKSNASYIEASGTEGSKNVITLLDMDIGKLLEMPEQMEKLKAMSEIKDVAAAKEAFKEIPNFKVETEEVINIQFE